MELADGEIAILLATRESENCQSLVELSQRVEAPIQNVATQVDSLVARGILEEVDCFDGIRYGYAGNDIAQQIYREVHRLSE
jgi:predicted transcriptional regulator